MRQHDDLMSIFQERHAFLNGHFLLSSGYHSPHYFQCALLFQDPALGARLGSMVAGLFKGEKINVVIGPAMGGILLAYEVARALKVRALFAEREVSAQVGEKGKMVLRRGLQLSPCEKVLLVEDVITTGGSIKEVIEVVKDAHAVPAGIAALVDRSGGTMEFPCQYKSLLQIPVIHYEKKDCPLCKEAVPLVKPGSRPLSIT